MSHVYEEFCNRCGNNDCVCRNCRAGKGPKVYKVCADVIDDCAFDISKWCPSFEEKKDTKMKSIW